MLKIIEKSFDLYLLNEKEGENIVECILHSYELFGVPPAFRKKTTLRKSELKNQKIYHYSKTHTVSFFIQKIIQHNIN
ncbi:hypothetical protein P4W04_31220, partial [Bacillus thuringiensis]|nr:hypothetical protein [Bacillus thuringiensis]